MQSRFVSPLHLSYNARQPVIYIVKFICPTKAEGGHSCYFVILHKQVVVVHLQFKTFRISQVQGRRNVPLSRFFRGARISPLARKRRLNGRGER